MSASELPLLSVREEPLRKLGGAGGVAPDEVLSGPIDHELGGMGGETGEAGDGAGARTGWWRCRRPTVRLNVPLDWKTEPPAQSWAKRRWSTTRERGAVDGDDRAARDFRPTGVRVVLVAQDPEGAPAAALDVQSTAVRVVDEAEVDLIVTEPSPARFSVRSPVPMNATGAVLVKTMAALLLARELPSWTLLP
jgi:hypothetical protein